MARNRKVIKTARRIQIYLEHISKTTHLGNELVLHPTVNFRRFPSDPLKPETASSYHNLILKLGVT
jgi:hypothetical protein